MKLTVTISRTSQGDADYLQVISDDQFSVNVVLIAEKVTVRDIRKVKA